VKDQLDKTDEALKEMKEIDSLRNELKDIYGMTLL
jgi:hypothetical protein